jgi:hypothetical protein
MRRGPDYSQYIDSVSDGLICKVPLELYEEFAYSKIVVWRDNSDGTYTLTPRLTDSG